MCEKERAEHLALAAAHLNEALAINWQLVLAFLMQLLSLLVHPPTPPVTSVTASPSQPLAGRPTR